MTAVHAPAPAYVELVHAMGTVITLDVRACSQPASLEAAFADAARRLHEIDALFSTWQHGSWVSRLVRGEVTEADCPDEVRGAVRLAVSLEALTDGYFSAHWRRPATGPDPIGLVKGWAAQRASDALLAHGLTDHVVNAAGDLVVAGSPEPGTDAPWAVGISDPFRAGEVAGAVRLHAARHRWSVATSGLSERGAHVVDPHTARYPTTIVAATTVVRVGEPHPEAGAVADACATALVAAGADASAAMLSRLAAHQVAGFVIDSNHRVEDPYGLLAR